MSFKNLLLLGPNQTGIANLNGVAEVFRKLAKTTRTIGRRVVFPQEEAAVPTLKEYPDKLAEDLRRGQL